MKEDVKLACEMLKLAKELLSAKNKAGDFPAVRKIINNLRSDNGEPAIATKTVIKKRYLPLFKKAEQPAAKYKNMNLGKFAKKFNIDFGEDVDVNSSVFEVFAAGDDVMQKQILKADKSLKPVNTILNAAFEYPERVFVLEKTSEDW